jgi:hypothetical protein
MRQTVKFLAWVTSASLAASGLTLAAAQPATDPALQARILQRSDGSLYVYRDGYRYWLQAAPLNDDEIDAILEADTGAAVERLDEFFFPPPPLRAPTAPSALPAAPSAQPDPAPTPTVLTTATLPRRGVTDSVPPAAVSPTAPLPSGGNPIGR